MSATAPPSEPTENTPLVNANSRDRSAIDTTIPTFKFDTDATPEEKAAAVKKAMPPTALDLNKGQKTANIITAATNGRVEGKDVLPQSAATATASTPGTAVSPASPYVNGHPKAGEGNWERTGWEPRFGPVAEAFGVDTSSADHQTWVEANLDEKFFGDWYHNAGVIVFSCLATWFVTKVGLGLVWVIIVLSCCATYYRTSIRRVRRNIRDDLNREFAKTRLDSDVESLEWINSFLVKFWPIYAPVISATVINTVDGILSNATPGFLDSIKLEKFNLGSKPPRLEHVKTYPKTENDIVEMDWKFSFTPKDTSDMTSKQIANQENPKVVLEVRVGKGLASKGFPIIVEDMQFSGRMKFKIKLQIPFPHIEKLDVCFLEPPEFDYALKPVGGDLFGVDIGFLPGLNSFIREMVHANLGPMFYAPNVFTVELAKMMAGAPTDTAIGVLQVTLHRAHGLKNSDKFSGTPDPYATISLNDRAVLAKTKTIHESADPRWNETKFILINNFNDPLTINVFDYNDIRKDKELGKATFALDVLEKDPVHENLTLEVISNNKTRGQVVADVKFFPVMKPIVLEDGTIEPVPETNTGILRYTIHQCKDLDGSKSMVGALSPYAIPYVNDKALPQTKIMKRTNNPIWGEVRELIVGNRSTAKLAIRIKDDRGLQADPVLGEYKVGLDDLMERMAKGQDWFDLAGVKTGRVKITAEWKPVELKGALGGSGGYVTPIGVMRVHLLNARGLKNLEAMGKSDPYVRILLSGIEKRRSVTFYNDLNPDWDEILYVPVHNTKEKITLEVMDEEKMGKDRSLGHLDVLCADYIKQAENGEYLAHDDNEMKSDNLVYGAKKTPKGKLNYSVSFFPCVNVADAEEEGEKKEATSGDASPVVSGSTTPGPMTPGPITPVTGRKSGESSQETLSVDSAPAAGEAASADAADLVADVKAEAAQAAADGPPKVKLTPDELLRHDCGIIVFKIIEGSFVHKDCHLEVVMDDHLYPSYTTKIRQKVQKIDDIGEAVVRELEWSKITLRIREDNKKEAEGDDEDHFIGRLKGNTFDTLKQCLNNPTVLTLRGKDGENKVKISLKYIPIQMKLDPRESVNNMGTLRVDVLDASNLPAADRNGKSDPYCTFELNDEKVFKSKVQKKTLHPAWNEFFETKIASRTAADFKISVYDWDMAGDDDFLGQSPINLSALEPFKQTLVNLKLRGKRGEVGDYGEVRLRFMFRSDYVTRSRQGSSTFGGTFAVPGKIVAAGAAVPLKGVGLAAGGVMKGASFLKNGFSRKSKEESISGLDPEELRQIEESSKAVAGEKDVGLVVPEGMADKYASASDDERGNRLTRSLTPSKNRSVTPTGFGSPHGRTKSINSVYSTSGSPSPGAEAGRATIRLISATGFPSSANVQARIRLAGKSKDLYKSKGIKGGNVNWDETTSIACTADQQFLLKIIDDHFIRGDKDLGETMFVLDDTGAGVEKEVAVGEGRVKFKAVFTAGSQASPDVSKKKKRNGLLRRV